MAPKNKPEYTQEKSTIHGAEYLGELCITHVPMSSGKPGRWESLSNGEKPTVLLCGLTPDNKLILERIFRFPVQDFCIELPGGELKESENPEAGVIREFREETGYEPASVQLLCRSFFWNAKTDKSCEIWLGTGCVRVGERKLDPMEEITQLEVILMSIPDVYEAIASGNRTFDMPISHALIALAGHLLQL